MAGMVAAGADIWQSTGAGVPTWASWSGQGRAPGSAGMAWKASRDSLWA